MTLVETVPPPVSGTPRPKASGKSLFVGDARLEVRGATYGTFQPGPLGTPFPEPCIVQRDFGLMAESGFNAVRVYTVPPEWLLDEASEAGLRVLVGLPWEQHVAFLDDPELSRTIQARVRHGVARCAGHPAVLAYAIGNEIPAPIVRWSGRRKVEQFLRHLYGAVKEQDPEALATYVNYPSTEYLDLPFLDLVAFNVFLESTDALASYVARLQNVAHDRPLLLTELGLDSQRNGVEAQAHLVEDQIYAARAGGCAGGFVFAWTDEWHRGGYDVEDWDFGLTTRDRRPKPALEAAAAAFHRPLRPKGGRWPSMTAVVCVHNGEQWIDDCLQGLTSLDYPDYEVVVVDDGSTDATADVVARYDVRSIRTENRGLSHARNSGIEAAGGEIVAFIDADARPAPDWLTHLALAFQASDFVGIGGPNIAPPGDGAMTACVANAPGGPMHVLRTDREAEHIPGCNMAFRRDALVAIGGFDPRFRVAGDDVDVCWRLQARGWKLGFAPAAVVWHHPRDSFRTFWKQQRGYGAAEAQLEAKWPEKYNAAGHVTWGGRVYGPPTVVFPGRRSRIYQGTWGEAPFQRLEPDRASLLWEMASMPEWYLALVVLVVLSGLGLLWHPLLSAVPVLLLAGGVTVARAIRGAARARFDDAPLPAGERRRRLGLVVLLHLMQPAARLTGRLFTGLVPWRGRARARRFAWPRPRDFALWRERGEPASRTLERIEQILSESGSAVRRGSGYDPWDLQVEGGSLGLARLRACVEEHGQGKQLLRGKVRPHPSALAWIALLAGADLALWSGLDRAWLAAGLLAAGTVLVLARTVWECGSSVAALVEALVDGEAALDSEPATSPEPAVSPKPFASPSPTTREVPVQVRAG